MAEYFETDEVVKEYDSKIFSRILRFVRPYAPVALAAGISLLFATSGEVFMPVLMRRLIDGTILAPPHDAARLELLHYSAALLIILLAVFLFTFLQTWFTQLISQNVMRDMRLKLFDSTVNQSSAFLQGHPVGRLVTRLTGDVETLNEFFTSVLSAFLKDFTIMIGVLLALFLLNARLAAVVLIAVPPVAVLSIINRTKARDAFRAQRSASSSVNSYLSERLLGREVVQVSGGETRSEKEFAGRNGSLLKANIAEMFVNATFRPSIEFLSTLTQAAVICVGAYFALGGGVSIGTLIAFINLVAMFFNPLIDIAEKYTILQQAMAGSERVFKLLDTDERIPDGKTGETSALPPDSSEITFDKVRFSYKNGEEVLRSLSLSVKDGERAAIVGFTGAGKSTLSNVLRRLWDIDSGRILFGGRDIREIPLPVLRSSVLPVLQDVFLFSETIAYNISLGMPLSREEVENAAKTVSAHDFICALPNGYDTNLAEGASNISQGQRQLISFARVIAHTPRVIVLDEATSSIDTETEVMVRQGIESLLSGRTSIVIAHRLSTIRSADRIFCLEHGVIAESGTHAELMAKNGIYASLVSLNETADNYSRTT